MTPIAAGVLLAGGMAGLAPVATSSWGGLMLNAVLSFIAVAGAVPLGIALAFGRRSTLPFVRALCTVLIEFWRGVPLLGVLFMGLVLLPMVLPGGVTVDNLIRALIVLRCSPRPIWQKRCGAACKACRWASMRRRRRLG